jgi:hypothetical protein
MIDTSTSPLRHALVASLLASSTLSAGCYRTVLIPPSELPRLAAAESKGATRLRVVDVDGEMQRISLPVDELRLVPRDPDHKFMQPPDVEWAIPVSEQRESARLSEGWQEANASVSRPFAASVGPDAIRLEQLPAEGRGPRKILVPARYVRAVELEKFDPEGTAGATIGIVLGATAVTVGTMFLLALAGGNSLGT